MVAARRRGRGSETYRLGRGRNRPADTEPGEEKREKENKDAGGLTSRWRDGACAATTPPQPRRRATRALLTFFFDTRRRTVLVVAKPRAKDVMRLKRGEIGFYA